MEGQDLIESTVVKYMEEFRMAVVFRNWVLGCYHRKNLENFVVLLWIKRSQRMKKNIFVEWKKVWRQETERKKKNEWAGCRIREIGEVGMKRRMFRDWRKAVLIAFEEKQKVFMGWKRFSEFKARVRRIEGLKNGVVQRNIEVLTKKMIFCSWKQVFQERFRLKLLAFDSFKRFFIRHKKFYAFRKRIIKPQVTDLEIIFSIFKPWQESSRKLQTCKKMHSLKLTQRFFQRLVEHRKKNFSKKLFNQKIFVHYTEKLKKRIFSNFEFFFAMIKQKAHMAQISTKHYKTSLLTKFFKFWLFYSTSSKHKYILILKSIHFWMKFKQFTVFAAFKFYKSLRDLKKSKIKQAKALRITDLQKFAIVQWINASLSLKESSENLKTEKEFQKQNKIWQLVQKFVRILKSKVNKRPIKIHQPQIPKIQFIKEENLDLDYPSRKRPEPRRLNLLSTIN